MSSTPSPSELRYTVVGKPVTPGSGERSGVSLLVLHRTGRPLYAESLQSCVDSGADETLVVLGPQPHYEVESLSTRLPSARFILLGREASVGDRLNVGIREARSPVALALWSDMTVPALSLRIVERVESFRAVCVVPALRNERNETMPSVIAPAFYRSYFRTIPAQPGSEGNPTLFPYADVGFFDCERFDRIGGYDPAITNPYWQRLDFGVRAHLWGERIAVLPSVRVDATRALPPEDTTPDASYARFHLKNLAIRFVRDQGRLPPRQLIPFLTRSGLGLAAGIREFRDVRAWVGAHRYRFVQDARRMTELWEVDE